MIKNSLIILLMVALIIVGTLYYFESENYDQLINIIKEDRDVSNLIVDGQYNFDYEIKRIEDEIFIPFNLIKRHIDPDIVVSNSGQRVYIDLDKIDFRFENDDLTAYVNENLESINIPFKVIDGNNYINIDLLKDLYGLYYRTYADNSILFISNNFDEYKIGTVNENKKVYLNKNDFLISFDEINKGEIIYLADETINDNVYSKIITPTGEIGYIQNVEEKDFSPIEREELVFNNREKKTLETVNLIWEQIYNYNNVANQSVDQVSGLNVISPTWFNLNVNGIIINIANRDYVKQSHEQGYEVWALYKNNFDPNWTQDLVTNQDNIQQSISHLLFYSGFYNLDGINIDFENVFLEDKENLVNYVREVRKMTAKMNLKLSLDAVVPGGSDRYSKVIDRNQLQQYLDYFILMAYDEHWGSSPTAGSVASIPWVEEGIQNTLKEVPKEKLVLGVPLYTRVWNTQGNRALSSTVYSMRKFPNYLEANDVEVVYDEETMQNYAENDRGTYHEKVWIEDRDSLLKRIELINRYDLAGIAGWSKGFEDEYYWDLINEYLMQ